MFEDIQVGDTVYFSTPHSAELKGRAVMFGPHGWVVNMGGRYGTPVSYTHLRAHETQ